MKILNEWDYFMKKTLYGSHVSCNYIKLVENKITIKIYETNHLLYKYANKRKNLKLVCKVKTKLKTIIKNQRPRKVAAGKWEQ